MQLTKTRPNTQRENRQLVITALAALSDPTSSISTSPYAADVQFVGPASGLWPEAGAPDPLGLFANPCLEIERVDAAESRVLTHATLRSPAGRDARVLFVHEIAAGRITKVSSVLSWS